MVEVGTVGHLAATLVTSIFTATGLQSPAFSVVLKREVRDGKGEVGFMVITCQQTAQAACKVYLELSDQEIKEYTKQLNEILHHLEKVKEAPVDGVEPTVHPVQLVNVFREDLVRESLNCEEALANAPHREGAYFRTPRVLE